MKIDASSAWNSQRTFYMRQWQSNGYYPIDKFVWDSERGMYEQQTRKGNSWKGEKEVQTDPLVMQTSI